MKRKLENSVESSVEPTEVKKQETNQFDDEAVCCKGRDDGHGDGFVDS